MAIDTGHISKLDLVIKSPPKADVVSGEGQCTFIFKVFGGGSEFQEKDQFTFIEEVAVGTDTIVFKLFKDGVLVATITDQTYGVFKALGTLTTQPLISYFIAEWDKIFTLEGEGCFHIETTITSLGVTVVKNSFCFELREYFSKVM